MIIQICRSVTARMIALLLFLPALVNADSSAGFLSSFTNNVQNTVTEVLDSIFNYANYSGVDWLLQKWGDVFALPLGTAMSVMDLVKAYGYLIEEYAVVTEDKYILTLHRIQSRTNSTNSTPGVVLLMPGIFSSSSCYFLNGNKSLGFILADLDYDVWIGNVRGTKYSRRHINRRISERKFFNFTLTEIGVYDLPAFIDYILDATGVESLYYIGHSQGTTDFFIMAAEKPEYNKKIRLMSAMAPVAFMGNTPSPLLNLLARFKRAFLAAVIAMNEYDLATTNPLSDAAAIFFCNDRSPFQDVCQNIIYVLGGRDPEQANKTNLPLFWTHFPEGTSVYVLIHYAQWILSGKFRKFDYGETGNQQKYGLKEPRDYDLNQISAPVALYYGMNDKITAPIDILTLEEKLLSAVRSYEIPYAKCSHFDFLLAKDVDKFLYNAMIEFMGSF